ncbi:MAG: hypothetical protein Q8T08_17825 [Ignavibacteria bacterium]|nr:hypothetical protein [Ignavibacteria bacterium]
MKANLLKKYWKQFLLLLFLSLNISFNFTPDGITVGVQQLYAQDAQEGLWQTGITWLDDMMNTGNLYEGTYFNDGSGNWSYCPDCAAHVNIYEVTVYGVDLSNTPVNLGISDLWHSTPTTELAFWEYWDYAGEIWEHVTTNEDPTRVTGQLSLVDYNTSARQVGTGGTLVMVGSDRRADLLITSYQPSTLNSNAFVWSGNGVSGSSLWGEYNGSTDADVKVYLASGTNPLVGHINI